MQVTVSLMLTVVTACGRVGFDELQDDARVDAPDDTVLTQTDVQVSAMANLWGAGRTTPPAPGGSGAGVLPTLVVLPAGSGRVLQMLEVAGTLDFGLGPSSPDGIVDSNPQTVEYGGLVSVTCTQVNALEAVFLDDNKPVDPAPPSLNMDPTATSFTAIGLRQLLFIGDGLTGTGSGEVQTFAIPDAATRLYIGLDDVPELSNQPGGYDDNSGTITATVVIR
ncbi:MAG: hypothetical protein ABI467_02225 [Kofleriaceae bacterium]